MSPRSAQAEFKRMNSGGVAAEPVEDEDDRQGRGSTAGRHVEDVAALPAVHGQLHDLAEIIGA